MGADEKRLNLLFSIVFSMISFRRRHIFMNFTRTKDLYGVDERFIETTTGTMKMISFLL